MIEGNPMLHLIAGKAGAGKSTLAAELGSAPHTVVISEDDWLSALFGEQMTSVADYARCADRLRSAMESHVVAVLRAGVSVVLDFPANTLSSRVWMRRLFEEADCAHRLYVLDVPDEVCRQRLRRRAASHAHPFTVTDEQFDLITSHFVAPSVDEGFEIVVYHHSHAEK